MRKFKFSENSYYHICNRSNDGSAIFFDERDYARFLFLILYYQASLVFYNLGRYISYFEKYQSFNVADEIVSQIVSQRRVALSEFAIMPNHFHLVAQEKTKTGEGIPSYLQRIETGYAKYFNAKYKKQGHLFQGRFRAVPIKTDEQFIYLSAYIHRNPRALQPWKNKEITYPWSSYQDFTKRNRWGELLKPGIILDQFPHTKDYQVFVETSTAKLQSGESPLDENILLESI